MKLELIRIINEDDYYGNDYLVRFFDEVFNLTKTDIHFIEIMQFYFERKASRSYINSFKYYPYSLKWKIISIIWSQVEWQWRKIYNRYRKH